MNTWPAEGSHYFERTFHFMAYGLALVRFLHWAASLLLTASLLARVFLLPQGWLGDAPHVKAWRDRYLSRLGRLARTAWAVALLSWVLWSGLTALIMIGTDQFSDSSVVATVLVHTQFGRLSTARLAILALTGGCLFASRRTPARERGVLTALTVALTILNTLTLALTGHAAATPGAAGTWHLAIDALHLAAASVWPGGLACFALLLGSMMASPALDLRTAAARATTRFSASSLVAVAVLGATGLANSCFFFHDVRTVCTSLYGRLLLAKVLLFFGMLGFGAWNLFVLKAKLTRETQGAAAGRPTSTTRALFRNVLWEMALGTLVILAVAVLGMTEPPRP
ncbi:MAG TPA: CopD family protein [Chthoniobacterales bacterium]